MHELGQLGFYVEKDKSVSKIIRKDYYYGRYYGLEFKAHRYPVGFKIVFYQNINFEHKCGGYYDFNKFEMMPYLQKLIFKKIVNKLGLYLQDHGVENESEPNLKTSEEKVKYRFVKSCHHVQENMNFNLSDLDGTTCEYSYNNTDRDKKTIYNGQIKYFRDYNGYLLRGKVYHNINNMWLVILNNHDYKNVASFELFDFSEKEKLGRLAKVRTPEEYLERKAKIAETSTRELIKELKRRGMRVS